MASVDSLKQAFPRQAAEEAGSDAPQRKVRDALIAYVQRSAKVHDYALARAAGRCERCARNAPFVTINGVPFLEVHHIRRLTDGGPDRLDAVAALCPNCHREAHHGANHQALNANLLSLIRSKKQESLSG